MFRLGLTRVVLVGAVAIVGLGAVAYQQERTFQLRSCGIRVGSQCQEKSCKCTRWLIEWQRSDGVITGVTVGPTLQAVEKQRDSDLEIDRAWAKMLGVPVTATPSQPICDSCVSQGNTTAAPSAASQTAARLFEEWTRKSLEELPGFVAAVLGPGATLLTRPAEAWVKGLMDHVRAWRQSFWDAKRLQREMLLTEQQANRVSTSLDAAARDLRADMGSIDSTFRALPPNVQSALRGQAATGPEGLEQLKQWVRTNFRQVVGRPISEETATDNAKQLQAFQERGQLQAAKDYFVKEVWPSLR